MMDNVIEYRPVPDYPGYSCGDNGVVYGPTGRAVRTWEYDTSGVRWLKLDNGETVYIGPVWYVVLMSWYRGNLEDVTVECTDGNVANSAVNNLKVVFSGAQKGRKRGLNRR
jgi:hypothetical protein